MSVSSVFCRERRVTYARFYTDAATGFVAFA